MITSLGRSRSDLNLTIGPLLVAVAVTGLALVVAAEIGAGAATRSQLHLLALAFYMLAALAALCEKLRPHLGAWCVALGLIAAVLASHVTLQAEGLLVLMVVPVAILFTTNGLGAALAIGGLATALLVVYQATGLATWAAVGVALVGLWAPLLTLGAFQMRVMQMDAWLEEYLQRARGLVEESRDRKAELAQALDDLTHLNRQMALMGQRQTELRQAAEQAEKAKATFVARVSHEFRTPLNIIIGMVDLMVGAPGSRNQGISDREMEHLRMVHRNCQHLASMVDDVLDLTRVQAQRMSLHRDWVDMRQLIGTAIQVVEPLIVQKGLALTMDCPDGLPAVYCDRIRIRQVVLNLLSNAARVTDQGGITLRLAVQGGAMLLSVSDTGPGIAAELVETIFEPFIQSGQPAEQGSLGGSGLGLSISRSFVEMHGGRLWAESEAGVGATFHVTIPIRPREDHLARPGHQISEEWAWLERRSRPQLPATQFKSRIVLCDSSGELGPSLSQLTDSIEFLSVPDLAAAIKELRQSPASAVIVNDISLSRLLRVVDSAAKAAPDTPVIGWSCPPRLDKARQQGALGYLVKPITRLDLERVVTALPRPVEKVLIVEDDADARELLQGMLLAVNSAIEVATAGSAEEALFRMRSVRPDLALIDIVLPGMDGWQLLAEIRDDVTLRNMPTVVVSGQDPVNEPLGSKWVVTASQKPMPLHGLLTYAATLAELSLVAPPGPEQMPQ